MSDNSIYASQIFSKFLSSFRTWLDSWSFLPSSITSLLTPNSSDVHISLCEITTIIYFMSNSYSLDQICFLWRARGYSILFGSSHEKLCRLLNFFGETIPSKLITFFSFFELVRFRLIFTFQFSKTKIFFLEGKNYNTLNLKYQFVYYFGYILSINK